MANKHAFDAGMFYNKSENIRFIQPMCQTTQVNKYIGCPVDQGVFEHMFLCPYFDPGRCEEGLN